MHCIKNDKRNDRRTVCSVYKISYIHINVCMAYIYNLFLSMPHPGRKLSRVRDVELETVKHAPQSFESQKQNTNPQKKKEADWSSRIKRFNAVAASLHIASAVIMTVMGLVGPALSVDVFALSPSFENQRFHLSSERLGNFKVFWLAVAFVLLAAIDHTYQMLHIEEYMTRVNRCCNWHRWLEYSVSAPVMHVHISLLSGMTDIFLLLAVFFLMHLCIVVGWVSDFLFVRMGTRKRWVAKWLFWFGCLPYVVQGAFILTFFTRSVRNSTAPDFVYAIIVIISVLDVAFALTQYLYMFKWSQGIGKSITKKAYQKGEFYFQVLSLTSKLSLAYIAFFGSRDMGN